MKLRFFLLILIFFINSLSAYDSLSILDKDTGAIVLKSPAVYKGAISANEAYNAFMQDKFKQLPTEARSLGFSNLPYWIGFVVANKGNEKLFFNLKTPLLNDAECFVYQENRLISSTKDSRFKLRKESVPTLYLIKINSKAPLFFSIQIGTSGDLESAKVPNLIIYSLFIACFVSLFLYNIVLYSYTRERLFLLYSVSSFVLFIFVSVTEGYFSFFFELSTLSQSIIQSISLQAKFIIFLFFTFEFLDIKKLSSKLYKNSIFIALSSSFFYVLMCFVFPNYLLNIVFLFFGTLFYILFGVIALFHKQKLTKIYLLALIGFLAGVIVSIMTINGFLEYNEFTYSNITFGSAWAMILFSLTMSHKIKEIQSEKSKSFLKHEAQDKMLFLQSRYASMGETVGNIAHQWKQPLNAIGSIQNSIKAALVFKGEISKEKLLESVNTSFKLLQHLGETIDTFYGFLSQRNNTHSSFVLSDEFETIRKITEYSFQNSNVQLNFDLHANPSIQGNANEFTHAMLNLILNAKNALDNSKPEEPTITVKVEDEENQCVITILDNAGGISIEPIESIFDWHISSKEDSSGVGLYMTKNIIEKRFGGSIKVENKEQGACFTIELPYAEHRDQLSVTDATDERPSLEEIKRLSKKIIELEELEKSLKKWADIFENAHWGISMRVGNSHRFEMTNPAFNELYGYTAEEVKTITVEDLFAPKSLDILPKMYKEAYANGYAVVEAINKRKDGSFFPVSIELIVIKDEQGEILYHIANIWDLTEKKEAEERLKLKKFAIDNIKESVFLADENGNLAYVNDEACRSLGYTKEELLGMSVADVDPYWPKERWPEFWDIIKKEKTTLVEAMHQRKDGSLFPVEVRANYFEYGDVGYNLGLARDITERMAAQKELMLLHQALNNTNEATYIILDANIVQVNDGACSMLGYTRAELTSMSLYDIDKDLTPESLKSLRESSIRRFERKHYTKDGRILDVEIDTSAFEYDGITYAFSSVRDITEQKKAREELLLKEFALDTINEAVYLIDKDSMFHYVNEGACHALGYTKEELLTMGVVDIDTDLTIEFWSKHWENIKHNKSDIVLRYHKRKDGTTFPIEVSANYFEYNGVEYNLAVSRDITERLQLEAEKENRIIRSITENSPDIIVRFDLEGNRTYINPKAAELFNLDESQLLGKTLSDVTPVIDKDTFEMNLKNVIKNGVEVSFETAYITASGKNGWAHMRMVPEFDNEGKMSSVLSIGRDITERRQMEAELRQKEEAYRTLAENNPDSIYRYDRNHRRIYVNPTACKIVGKSAEELIGGTPDDGAILVSQQSKIVDEQIDQVFATGESADFMVNFIEQNGDANDYHMLMVPEYDAEGNVASVLGFTRNVTEIRSLEKRQSQYFAMAPGLFATVLKEAEGNYSLPFVSEGIRDVYGIEPEVAMEDISAFVAIAHPDDTEMTFTKAEESARTLAPYHVEYRINHPHKGIRWIECNSMPQRMPDGSVRWDAFYHDITERKQSDEMLRMLNHSIDVAQESLLIIDTDKPNEGNFLLVNNAAAEMFGYSKEELIGGMGVMDINPDFDFTVLKEHQKELQKVKSLTFETRHKSKNGRIFPVEVRSSYFEYENKKYILSLIIEITERKEMEEALKTSEQKFRTLVENLPDNVIRYDKECRAIYLSPRMERVIGQDAVAQMIGKTPLEVSAIDPLETKYYQQTMEQVLASGEKLEIEIEVTVPSGEKQTHIIRFVAEQNQEGEIYGVLAIGSDITERKEMEEALKTSEQKFRTLIENATDNIIRYDKEARITYLNPQLERVLGVSSEVLFGTTPTQFITDGTYDQYEIELKKVIATGENAHTYVTLPDTGEGEQYHYIHIVAERDVDGNIIGAIAFGRDVTELTNKTNELQKSLEFNEGVIAAIPDLLLEVAPDGTYVGVWAQNPEILAAQREMLLGNDFKEILPPDVVIIALQTLKEVDEKGFSLGNTYSLDLPEGKRWFELSASKKKSSGNYIILARDITERKQIEESLREAQHIANVGSWEVDIVHNKLTWSDETYRIWEIDKEQFEATFEAFLETVHPDDREIVAKTYNDSIINHSNYDIEHRLLFSDGRIKYIHERGEPYYNENGEPIRFIGTALDITERKEIEDELKESETRYRKNSNLLKAVLESSPDIITFALDTNYCYIAFNSKHADVMRALWGKEIAIGMNMLDMITLDDDRQVAKNSFDRALSGEHFISEEIYGDSDFSRSYWEIFYAPILSDNKEIIGLTCFNIDITERKIQEKKLNNLYELSPLGIALTDINGRYLEFNDAFCKICGYSLDELQELDYWSLTPIEYEKQEFEQLESLKQTGRYGPYEKVYRQKNGNLIPIQLNGVLVKGNNGEEYIWSIVEDITERKLAENTIRTLNETLEMQVEERTAELRDREETFRAMVENSPDVIMRYDLQGRRTYVNPIGILLMNKPLEELIGKTPKEYSPLPDTEEFEQLFAQVVSEGKEIEIEAPYKMPNGEIRWGNQRIVPEFDTNGNVVSVLVIGRDLTERKEIENRLQLVSAAINSSNEAIYINDKEMSIVYVNEGACKMLGYTREELTSMKIYDIDALFNQDDLLVFSEEVLETKQAVFKTKHKAKDGRIIDVEIVGNPFTFNDMEVFVSVVKDITNKK